MSKKYFGDTFDIHGGGKDLIFPHHENEIAQSEAASHKTFVQNWIHHGFVTIKDEKMSKSLGNFLTIREILEKYSAEVLRFFTFSTHYRSPIDYSDNAMQDAETGLDRLYSCLAEIQKLPSEGQSDKQMVAGKKNITKIQTIEDRFIKAMDNDFNSAQAIGHIFDVVKSLNTIKQSLPPAPSQSDLDLLHKGADDIKKLTATMGLLQQDAFQYIKDKQQKVLEQLDIDISAINVLIDERNQARNDKNWAKADEIRDKLLDMQIEIKDDAEGTSWQVKI